MRALAPQKPMRALEAATDVALVAVLGAILEGLELPADVNAVHRPGTLHMRGRIAGVTGQAGRLAGALDAGPLLVAGGAARQGQSVAVGARMDEVDAHVSLIVRLERQRRMTAVARRQIVVAMQEQAERAALVVALGTLGCRQAGLGALRGADLE